MVAELEDIMMMTMEDNDGGNEDDNGDANDCGDGNKYYENDVPRLTYSDFWVSGVIKEGAVCDYINHSIKPCCQNVNFLILGILSHQRRNNLAQLLTTCAEINSI